MEGWKKEGWLKKTGYKQKAFEMSIMYEWLSASQKAEKMEYESMTLSNWLAVWLTHPLTIEGV